jgi:hypothetical protein
MLGVPVNLWRLRSCASNLLHTGLRVQRAPGIPCALFSLEGRLRPYFSWGEQFQHNSGDSRRGNADVYLENWNTVIARSEATTCPP